MKWGMIVRSDCGGLGNQTYEIWRELKPDKTLVASVPDPRGGLRDIYRRASVMHAKPGSIDQYTADMFVHGLDLIVSIEGFYGPKFEQLSIQKLLIANPELYSSDDHKPDRIVVPTAWMLGRMPAGTAILPHPTSMPPIERFRIRDSVDTFVHPWAPAMLDRNGTETVMRACYSMAEKCELIVRAPGKRSPDHGQPKFKIGRVTVYWDSRVVENWWQNYEVEADCLLLPRRYGGLCLPAQEAASCGMPNLMTDLLPQRMWPGWRIPTSNGVDYEMKGGMFRIHGIDEQRLAKRMDALVRGEDDVTGMSTASIEWAQSLDWSMLRDVWKSAIQCV